MRTTSAVVAQQGQQQLLKSNKNTNIKRRANEKKEESAVIKFKNRIPSSSPAPGENRDVANSETSKSSRRALLATKEFWSCAKRLYSPGSRNSTPDRKVGAF